MTIGDLVSPMRGARAASSPAGLARLLDFVSWQDCFIWGGSLTGMSYFQRIANVTERRDHINFDK